MTAEQKKKLTAGSHRLQHALNPLCSVVMVFEKHTEW